jgi:hypothetical protein
MQERLIFERLPLMHSAIVVINMPEKHESEGHHPKRLAFLERFSVDVNRNSKGVPKGAQIRLSVG